MTTDKLISDHYTTFTTVPDLRNRIIGQSLADILQAGFAMFHLKFCSLLDFDNATTAQRDNIKSVYGISKVCSDTQMRRMIDRVEPTVVEERIHSLINEEFHRSGTAREYTVFDGRLIVSLDGVEHFRSHKVHCASCLVKHSKTKGTSYYHQMLCGSIVHPDQAQVFPAVVEPIVKQDGQTKNDCERNAAMRVIDQLNRGYAGRKLLIVADGLYSCGPFLDKLIEYNHDFIITAKPGDHKALFKHFTTWSDRGATKKLEVINKGVTHRFEWANGLGLNETWSAMKLNVLMYEQIDAKGRVTRFSWVTNRKLSKRNVEQIMRIGRSRWKVENETFNTLKNQGYNFEHNYGHGHQYLSTTLSYLMLLAFLTDQLIERCCEDFRLILGKTKTRVKLWFQQRALFTSQAFDSFNGIYGRLAELFGVQLI